MSEYYQDKEVYDKLSKWEKRFKQGCWTGVCIASLYLAYKIGYTQGFNKAVELATQYMQEQNDQAQPQSFKHDDTDGQPGKYPYKESNANVSI